MSSHPPLVPDALDDGGVAGTSRTVIDLVTGPSCSLAGWSGRPGRCRWCDGAAQVGTRWCGTVCEDAYRNNHDWASARQAVLTRDRDRCAMCGTGPDTVAIARLLIRALIPLGPVEAARLWHSSDWWAFELGLLGRGRAGVRAGPATTGSAATSTWTRSRPAAASTRTPR